MRPFGSSSIGQVSLAISPARKPALTEAKTLTRQQVHAALRHVRRNRYPQRDRVMISRPSRSTGTTRRISRTGSCWELASAVVVEIRR